MIVKIYKKSKKYVCFIAKTESGLYRVRTGKPSDSSFISWSYKTLEEAEKTAQEYFDNCKNFY